jgi:uncharacterized membrane protein YqiK
MSEHTHTHIHFYKDKCYVMELFIIIIIIIVVINITIRYFTLRYTECPQMITLISTGCNILTVKTTE